MDHGGLTRATEAGTKGGDACKAVAGVTSLSAAIRSGECRIARNGLGISQIGGAVEQTAGRIVGCSG